MMKSNFPWEGLGIVCGRRLVQMAIIAVAFYMVVSVMAVVIFKFMGQTHDAQSPPMMWAWIGLALWVPLLVAFGMKKWSELIRRARQAELDRSQVPPELPTTKGGTQ